MIDAAELVRGASSATLQSDVAIAIAKRAAEAARFGVCDQPAHHEADDLTAVAVLSTN